jgi:hypothetical protein
LDHCIQIVLDKKPEMPAERWTELASRATLLHTLHLVDQSNILERLAAVWGRHIRHLRIYVSDPLDVVPYKVC